MLNENIKEILTERLAKRIEELNTKVLTKIVKSIDELGTLTPTNAQRVANLLKYGGDYQKLIKEIQKVTGLNAKEVEQILDEVAKKNYLSSKDYYTIKDMNYLPYKENLVLQQQVDMLKK
jgi:Asp-tRNA(Asn)/Glu-tRNA(Gln) amidotransferase B subunit